MSLLQKAKTLAKPATAAKKAERLQIEISDIEKIAVIEAAIKTMTSTAEALKESVKEAGFQKFIAMATETRPDSFTGIDGKATASVEMRKRGTNSALNEDECNVLRQNGIQPFEQQVTPELFAINPKYATDAALIAKVEKALARIVPEDFFVHQEGVSKMVVSDEMLDEAFKKRNEEVLRIVTCMALKPKLNQEYDQAGLLDHAKSIVQPPLVEKKAILPGKTTKAKAA